MKNKYIKIDTHTHTHFSQDSVFGAENRISDAEAKGLSFLSVTDHMDIGCSPFSDYTVNYNLYFDTFNKLRNKYRINFAIGIECGYSDDNIDNNSEVLSNFPFEYIINSVHSVGGRDCYFTEYFDGKTKSRAYNDYFETVYRSIGAPYNYDAVGHLGYVTRHAPYPDKNIDMKESGEIIDAILKKIITRNKILEVNANIKTFSPHTPDTVILKRYRELGGELITYGSDAHNAAALIQNYENVIGSIKECGFGYIFVMKNRELTPVKI